MANVVNTGDYVEVAFVFSCGNQAAVNVYHFRNSVTALGTPTDIQVANYFDGLAATLYKPMISNESRYEKVKVTILRLPPPVTNSSNASAGIGTNVSDVLPTQISGVITKLTNLRGRANRGRIYVPFPTESDSDTKGLPNATYMTALTNLANNLLTTHLITDGTNNGVFDPYLRHGKSLPFSGELIVGSTPRQKWGEQHRRGSYGRPN